MSDQVNKEQAKGMKQEETTELSDDQLDEAAGGASLRGIPVKEPIDADTPILTDISTNTEEMKFNYAVKDA